MQNFKEFSVELDEARMTAAQKLSNAWDKQRAKSDASLRRTPSSIPKKEEPKKEVTESLDTHEMAMSHKDKASKALETSDMKSFHAHMASHHESMGQWHESKGRHSAADREYAKGEEHHEKSLKPDNSRTVSAKNEETVAEGSEYKSRHAHKQEQDKAYADYRTKHNTSSMALLTKAEFAKDQRERAAKKKQGVAEGQLDEISQDTARSYAQKATQSKKDLTNKTYRKGADTDKLNKKIQNRQQGLNRAHTDKRYYKDDQGVAESAICQACAADPCICDDSHGFVSEAAQGHTIEAQGIRGMKSTPWRKTFKNHEHLAKWADANDSVEVHGTRDLDQARKGNLSPAMKEEAELHEDDTHAVHINGRQWKTFSTKSHADNVAKKIKGATVHKYDAEKLQTQYHAKLSARNAARGKEWDESTSITSFKRFIE